MLQGEGSIVQRVPHRLPHLREVAEVRAVLELPGARVHVEQRHRGFMERDDAQVLQLLALDDALYVHVAPVEF
jgi:hypothetical protein